MTQLKRGTIAEEGLGSSPATDKRFV